MNIISSSKIIIFYGAEGAHKACGIFGSASVEWWPISSQNLQYLNQADATNALEQEFGRLKNDWIKERESEI